MTNFKRTHTCGELTSKNVGETVSLSGWLHKRRDLGNLIFINLRDKYGITQIVFNPQDNKDLAELASTLKQEWVINVKGIVQKRAEGMHNKEMKTGEIEIIPTSLDVLSKAKTPPITISDSNSEVNEELALKYRYLSMRKGPIIANLELRNRCNMAIRSFFNKEGFVEVTTPILSKSTPEGARDYLVPSRVFPGNFFALPQSPQIFKQLLMVGGMDKYFQLAQCFRDEDLRADRQPEFTQLDLEMSFKTPDDLFHLLERLCVNILKETKDIEIESKFPRITYAEAIEKYGSDKPDIRYDMHLQRIDNLAKESSFSTFHDILNEKGCIKAIVVKNAAELSRKQIEKYQEFLLPFKLKHFFFIKNLPEGVSSSLKKFFTEEQMNQLIAHLNAKENDLIIIAGGKDSIVNQSLDQLRRLLAKEMKLTDPNKFQFLWITDFPLFSKDEETGALKSEHHPFTHPNPDDMNMIDSTPEKMRALAYDLVLNGYELGSGSQRIHEGDLQNKIFQMLNLSEADIKRKFGFFVEGLQYGTPPHIGIALGLDRFSMILCGTDNIRDVIAYPKTTKASDLMCQSPSLVEKEQLDDLALNTSKTTDINW
ncbi:MAG TPA: aspartate--tRNA ligase [Chlamydiales bacterium]|nr:aspartate--tRNA ligase [Chlamydiales bacterium]